MPHMHARGKDMTYSLEFPDGRKQVILLCRYAVGSSSLAA